VLKASEKADTGSFVDDKRSDVVVCRACVLQLILHVLLSFFLHDQKWCGCTSWGEGRDRLIRLIFQIAKRNISIVINWLLTSRLAHRLLILICPLTEDVITIIYVQKCFATRKGGTSVLLFCFLVVFYFRMLFYLILNKVRTGQCHSLAANWSRPLWSPFRCIVDDDRQRCFGPSLRCGERMPRLRQTPCGIHIACFQVLQSNFSSFFQIGDCVTGDQLCWWRLKVFIVIDNTRHQGKTDPGEGIVVFNQRNGRGQISDISRIHRDKRTHGRPHSSRTLQYSQLLIISLRKVRVLGSHACKPSA